MIEVDLELEDAGTRSVDEVRHALASAIKQDPDVWEDDTGSLGRILDALEDADSIDGLWKVMIPLLTPAQP